MKIIIEGVEYEKFDVPPKAGDLFSYYNPLIIPPRKEVVRKCLFVHPDGTIQPSNDLCIRMLNPNNCRKIVRC